MVDYYHFNHAVQFFADFWCANIAQGELRTLGTDKDHNRKITLLLHVACVFDNQLLFSGASLSLMRHARGPIQTLGLPIPETVIGMNFKGGRPTDRIADILKDRINEASESSLVNMVTLLHDLKTYLSQNRDLCSLDCSSILLGVLSMGIRKNKLQISQSEPRRLSVTEMFNLIKQFRTPTWYTERGGRHLRARSTPNCEDQPHECTLYAFFGTALKDIYDSLRGLDLADFQTSRKS